MNTRAFTLLELSIVLVIIGLLIGGIFVGQSLIHTAQLNAVISEFNRYQTAVQNFKQQYQALPGDMNNATSFWGSAGGAGNDPTCFYAGSTTTATCNGNGDGLLDVENTQWGEIFGFWKQLVNARMIDGSYTGQESTAVSGTNIPLSKFPAAGWNATSGANLLAGWNYFQSFSTIPIDYGTGNILVLGANSGATTMAYGNVLTPKDAWSIDKKLDDGVPISGNVISSAVGCTTAPNFTNDVGATYALSTTSVACSIVFIPGF